MSRNDDGRFERIFWYALVLVLVGLLAFAVASKPMETGTRSTAQLQITVWDVAARLNQVCEEPRPGFVRVARPSQAARLGRHLEQAGLAADEESEIMERGTWPPIPGSSHVFAMAGHAWG